MPIEIHVTATELWDPLKEEFVKIKEQNLLLEHSLLSIHKWEAKWKKSYLNSTDKSKTETLDYLRCMTLTKNVNPYTYFAIPNGELIRIKNYIEDPMTATTFSDTNEKGRKNEIITAEIIYWEMDQLNIPLDWEKRHFNQLLTLIKVSAIKNAPPKKMSRGEIAMQNKALNAARRAKHHTRG